MGLLSAQERPQDRLAVVQRVVGLPGLTWYALRPTLRVRSLDLADLRIGPAAGRCVSGSRRCQELCCAAPALV